MSEKRFELRSYGNEEEIQEIRDKQGESLFTWEDIEKKLNQLSEENEQLKKENKRLEKNLKLQKENVESNFESRKYWKSRCEAAENKLKAIQMEDVIDD